MGHKIVTGEGGTGTGKTAVVRVFVNTFVGGNVGRLLLCSQSNEAALRMVEGSNDTLKNAENFLYIPSRKMARSGRVPMWLEQFSFRQRRGNLVAALFPIFEAARNNQLHKVAQAFNKALPLIVDDWRQYQVRPHYIFFQINEII